ncbi:MAG: polysaccharide biosynthesis/export family protein [Desulfobulbaceae bacterium]|nr:polysaccharide biosynthesis/export family protein [Desulfobulbaceae bacterium]
MKEHPQRKTEMEGGQKQSPGPQGGATLLALSLFLYISILLSQTACVFTLPNMEETEQKNDAPSPEQIIAPETPLPPDYALQPGDMLDIVFLHNNELNEQLPVRPDGKIALQLIGELDVYNLTLPELRKILETKYDARLADPEIVVSVESTNSRIVYVDGEVNKPGIVRINGSLSLMGSLSEAGGLRSKALNKEVIIIRRNKGRPVVIATNLQDCLEKDIPLMPFDVVYVPATMIEVVNQWVLDYIRTSFPITYHWNYDLTDYE